MSIKPDYEGAGRPRCPGISSRPRRGSAARHPAACHCQRSSPPATQRQAGSRPGEGVHCREAGPQRQVSSSVRVEDRLFTRTFQAPRRPGFACHVSGEPRAFTHVGPCLLLCISRLEPPRTEHAPAPTRRCRQSCRRRWGRRPPWPYTNIHVTSRKVAIQDDREQP
jgi:hypothetical protein